MAEHDPDETAKTWFVLAAGGAAIYIAVVFFFIL
jgi:hypothetical protein